MAELTGYISVQDGIEKGFLDPEKPIVKAMLAAEGRFNKQFEQQLWESMKYLPKLQCLEPPKPTK